MSYNLVSSILITLILFEIFCCFMTLYDLKFYACLHLDLLPFTTQCTSIHHPMHHRWRRRRRSWCALDSGRGTDSGRWESRIDKSPPRSPGIYILASARWEKQTDVDLPPIFFSVENRLPFECHFFNFFLKF